MKVQKNIIVLILVAVLSLFTMVGNGWSEQVELPHAFFNGLVQTYLDNGVNDDLVFLYTTINNVVLSDGMLNPSDSIIGATVAITGAKRDPLATPGTTFTNATLTVSNGTTQFFSATLNNIEFVLIDGLWRLNPDLDINDPVTLNLSEISLDTGSPASDYILDLQASLGSQSIAGMMMTLNTFLGDITGDSQSGILEGLIDGVPLAPVNVPPVADAGATTNDVSCLGTTCDITMDGSQSTDEDSTPGTNDDIEFFKWYDESGTLIGSGETATVSLPLGMHNIKLTVTDFAGDSSEAIVTIVIDPAELSLLEINRAHVKKDGKVKISGKLALPAGVSHYDVNSVGSAAISISTLGIVIDESVDFVERRNNKKWKYHESTQLGIKRFNIDWMGSKFNYVNGPLRIKSHHIGEEETSLEIISCSAVTVDINGVVITLDENDNVSCSHSGSRLDRDNDGDSDDSDSDGGNRNDDDNDCTVRVTLPFELTPDMVVTITETVNDSFTAGDHYTAAVGRFRFAGRFDATGVVFNDLDPKTLDLSVTLGDEGFTGALLIEEGTWTKIKSKHWRYKSN